MATASSMVVSSSSVPSSSTIINPISTNTSGLINNLDRNIDDNANITNDINNNNDNNNKNNDNDNQNHMDLIQLRKAIAERFIIHENGQLVGPTLPFYYTRINANKILDGLFLGNQESAHDLDFLMSIKCKYVLNCAASSIPNLFARFGLRYMSLRWYDSKNCTLFEQSNNNHHHHNTAQQIFDFVNNALINGHSILVHSSNGDSRSCIAVAVYLSLKFQWSVLKCLEYISFKRPECNPRPHFIHQLTQVTKPFLIMNDDNSNDDNYQRIGVGGIYSGQKQSIITSQKNNNNSNNNHDFYSEHNIEDRWCGVVHSETELVVRNTFLNSHRLRVPLASSDDDDPKKGKNSSLSVNHACVSQDGSSSSSQSSASASSSSDYSPISSRSFFSDRNFTVNHHNNHSTISKLGSSNSMSSVNISHQSGMTGNLNSNHHSNSMINMNHHNGESNGLPSNSVQSARGDLAPNAISNLKGKRRRICWARQLEEKSPLRKHQPYFINFSSSTQAPPKSILKRRDDQDSLPTDKSLSAMSKKPRNMPSSSQSERERPQRKRTLIKNTSTVIPSKLGEKLKRTDSAKRLGSNNSRKSSLLDHTGRSASARRGGGGGSGSARKRLIMDSSSKTIDLSALGRTLSEIKSDSHGSKHHSSSGMMTHWSNSVRGSTENEGSSFGNLSVLSFQGSKHHGSSHLSSSLGAHPSSSSSSSSSNGITNRIRRGSARRNQRMKRDGPVLATRAGSTLAERRAAANAFNSSSLSSSSSNTGSAYGLGQFSHLNKKSPHSSLRRGLAGRRLRPASAAAKTLNGSGNAGLISVTGTRKRPQGFRSASAKPPRKNGFGGSRVIK